MVVFCYGFLTSSHCGRGRYLVWQLSFQLYLDLFCGLTSGLSWRVSHVHSRGPCGIAAWDPDVCALHPQEAAGATSTAHSWAGSGACSGVLRVQWCSVGLFLLCWAGLSVLIMRFPLCSLASTREHLEHLEQLSSSLKFSSDMDNDPTPR